MATAMYGSKLISGLAFKQKFSGCHSVFLRNSTTRNRYGFDIWKDWWLGYGARRLKFWDGLTWQTITSS